MGVFWLSIGILYVPLFGITASYSPTGSFIDGFSSPQFHADLGTYLVCWGLVTFVLLVCSIKTNILSIVLFGFLDVAFFLFAAAHFQVSYQNPDAALILQKVHLTVLRS
jgi:uncharacterized protein